MRVYLDNAATSWPKPESVYLAIDQFMREVGATPGRGGYQQEEEAQQVADDTRAAISKLFHAPDPQGIVFTLNATYALNMALKGILKPGDHVVTSSVEHNAMWRPLKALEKHGVQITTVPCSSAGLLDPSDVENAVRANTHLIAMLHASNVLGTILPIAEVGKIAHDHRIPFLLDAAQTAGNMPIDMQTMGIDLLAFAGHKGIYGPPGTGGLVVTPGLQLEPWVEGGTGFPSRPEMMPDELPIRLEAGTQNSAGVAGLLAGVNFVLEIGVDPIHTHEMKLCSRLIEQLAAIKGLKILGPKNLNQRVALVSFTVDGYVPDQLSAVLDKVFNIASRSGLHCAPQAHIVAGTIEHGALRFSPGYFTTLEEIDYAVESMQSIL